MRQHTDGEDASFVPIPARSCPREREMKFRIRVVSLGAIQRLAAQAVAGTKDIPAFAGTASVEPAPNGLGTIIGRSGSATLGSTGGLTLLKNAAAFTIPAFVTQNSVVRQGNTVHHYAQVQRTTSGDATHECYYPGSGDHVRPGMTQHISGQVYTHYWRISPQVSELIRRGEEEHLADAKRAYELTYKLIADTIHSMLGQRFGPARSPAEADKLAEAELAKRLPKPLGTDPRNWVAVLDRLLGQTKERDRRGWHAISVDPPQTIGNRIIHPVVMGVSTRIGQISSSQVINY